MYKESCLAKMDVYKQPACSFEQTILYCWVCLTKESLQATRCCILKTTEDLFPINRTSRAKNVPTPNALMRTRLNSYMETWAWNTIQMETAPVSRWNKLHATAGKRCVDVWARRGRIVWEWRWSCCGVLQACWCDFLFVCVRARVGGLYAVVDIYLCIYVYLCKCMYASMYVHIRIYIHTYIYTYMYIYIYIYIYMNMHTHSNTHIKHTRTQ